MRAWFGLVMCLLPFSAAADTASDKDFLTNWLETNLSGAGRTIVIDGFQGALSSQASLTQMTIADDKGVWLTLKNVTLDWSRSALLTGKIEVNALAADEIDLERLPSTGDASGLPSAEAKPLSLPDLPVSINVTGINARKIVLGAQVLGQPLEASLTADLSLAGGEGAAHLDLQRLGDGPQGHVKLAASFDNSTQVLDINLDAAEGKGGIAANLLHVPGAPATSLTVVGKGTLSDFAATVNLSTDGETRLAGQLTQTDDVQGTRSFSADLAGDPTPVFLPEYAAFFGPNVKIQAKGQRAADGALNLTDFSVQAQALNLKGNLAMAADGQPRAVNLTGTIGLAQGPVTLPIASAQPVTLASADVSLAYDKTTSDLWHFATTIAQLNNGSFAAGRVQLTADGRLQDMLFDGAARFAVSSLAPTDPGLAAAVGDTITGTSDFSWSSDTSALQVTNLSVTAPGYAITTKGSIGKLADLRGNITGHYDDLSRLAKLTGRPLAGSVRFDLDGSGSPISGAFDVTGAVASTALQVGVAQVDTLLAGNSKLHISAKRDETGTTLRAFSVEAASLSADISGTIASAGSDLSGDLRFADLAALGTGYRGSLTAKGSFKGTLTAGLLNAEAHGKDVAIGQAQADGFLKGDSDLTVKASFAGGVATIEAAQATTEHGKVAITGTVSAADSKVSATLSLPDVSALGAGFRGGIAGTANFAGKLNDGSLSVQAKSTNLAVGQPQADALLRGTSTVSAKVLLTAKGIQIEQADLANPQLKAGVTGFVDGATRNLTVSARLANLGLLYPQFPGALVISGTAAQGDSGTTLDLGAKGPGQIDAKVKGTVSADYSRANIAISGTATAALAGALIAPRSIDGALRFDLRLNGPLALSSLSGPVSISGGRLADPSLTFALKDLTATATLGSGRVQVNGSAGVSTGGMISAQGSVGLAAPYSADLALKLDQVVLRDPELYTTKLNGNVSFKGPALGGATIAGNVALDRTELRIPSTGFGADGNLPGLKHVSEPAAVKATRARAGVGVAATAKSGNASGYNLNLTISAPNQVFVRGRGLDAELGGSLVLRGTTARIVPSGAFNLIRGRLDILGRRLVLSEAQVQLQGALVPYIHVVASVESDGITASVVINGDATDPVVTFTSSPDLPQEEVVARLLFDRGLATISAFQAAQLATAVGSLAGKGGDGLIGNLRRKTGLDNLDLQTDGNGGASLTAGKYLSDKTYSEVTVDQGGKSAISLNYDVARHITLKVHVNSEGATGAGVYLKRDY